MAYGGANEAWIVGAVRTPVGRHGGALSAVRPDDLGAIALGSSGARSLTTLVHEMRRREDVRYGPATMCVGVRQGIATVVENAAQN